MNHDEAEATRIRLLRAEAHLERAVTVASTRSSLSIEEAVSLSLAGSACVAARMDLERTVALNRIGDAIERLASRS